MLEELATGDGCYQSVKDKNFESNSQQDSYCYVWQAVVISLSKIKISKAIHNYMALAKIDDKVVISLSKIKISKAIHNESKDIINIKSVVISLSKIKISKETAYLCVKDNVALVIVSRQAHYEDDEAALFSF